MTLRLLPALLLLSIAPALSAQDQYQSRLHPRERWALFPAISYAPETSLTLGVVGIHNIDMFRGDSSTQISNVQFLAIYTLNKQVSIFGEWELFTNGNQWRFRGRSFFDIYPDRNYGRGNEASALVAEIEEDGSRDTLNYLRYNSNRLNFSPEILRQIRPGFYAGLLANIEYQYKDRPIPDRWTFANADSNSILDLPTSGLRVGLGFSGLYDTRDYVLNPLRGTFTSMQFLAFIPSLGSDFGYQSLQLDIRQYLNPVLNHTLALRLSAFARFSSDPDQIPIRGLARVGGRDFMRGYFQGTYQDRNLVAFEAEYRLPFWKEDGTDPLWKVWKHIGLVAFAGGAQVQEKVGDFRGDAFRIAAGGGLRILFNRASRVTLRVDYAFGFAADSHGPGRRQSGFYFALAEAF